MNYFEIEKLNEALKNPTNDACVLAANVMKALPGMDNSDAIWDRLEQELLEMLIKRVRADLRGVEDFGAIHQILVRNNLDVELRQQADWLEFLSWTTEATRKETIRGLRDRLDPFVHYAGKF